MLKRFRSFFRLYARRRDFEDGMTEELRFHIEQYTEDLVRSGVSREEAGRRARIEFGGLNTVKADCREARGLQLFDEVVREVSHAARLLRKTPGFTVAALLTLAVCIGANLTIFAMIDSILLRSLPFPQAGRLVSIYNTYPKAGVERDGSSITNYYERRGHIPAFAWLAIYGYGTAIIGEAGSSQREPVTRAAQNLRQTFIVAQIALALVLVTGSGLLALSLKRVMEVSPGFRSDHILTGQISLPWKKYRDGTARLALRN